MPPDVEALVLLQLILQLVEEARMDDSSILQRPTDNMCTPTVAELDTSRQAHETPKLEKSSGEDGIGMISTLRLVLCS